jgi:signal transduction histidine kinase/DNA-binding response OmpR family regulator
MDPRAAELSARILILTPFGKDAQHLLKVLGAEGFACRACRDVAELVVEFTRGASVLLTTEEVMASKEAAALVEVLKGQESWSAIPLLVFFSLRDGKDPFQRKAADPTNEFAEVSFLQRPVSSLTLTSAIRGALRDRERQHRMRDLLGRLQEDLDARSRQEEELKKAHAAAEQAKQAAESANASKSQFLANMSHEIRTPLGAVMGYAELLAQPETTSGEVSNYVSVIRRNSVQLLRIIDDILDLSKVESGKMDFEAVAFSLPDLLGDFCSLLALRARENAIEFEMNALTPLPDRIVCDSTRLRQILMNVVGNAIKFTEGGRVALHIHFADGLLSFEVQDTGRGISPEQSAALFRPFQQADSSTTRKFAGTGLGLVLTRRLCEAMGGEFFLKESALGKGSTFVARVRAEVALPVADGEGQNQRPSNPSPLGTERLANVNVLLVEDSPDNQDLIRILLRKAGAAVDLAVDGVEGVEMAILRPYDIILMDVQMPRMGGIEAVRILREKGLALPIAALTAHAMKDERERCLLAGFSSFLAKPIQQEALIGLVEALLGGARSELPGHFGAARSDPLGSFGAGRSDPPPSLFSARRSEAPPPLESSEVASLAPDSDVLPVAPSVLVIEDDEDARDLLVGFLEGRRVNTAGVPSADAALAHLAAHGMPPVILLDLSLPGRSGAELMGLLNARHDRDRSTVLLVSGWDDLPRKTEALKADGFFRKPIALDRMREKIEGLLAATGTHGPDLARSLPGAYRGSTSR